MGNINAVPIVSQTKSLVQVIAGDEQGALATQVAFSKECPIVSQVNSAVHAAMGDLDEARRIQEVDFVGSLASFANALPIIGHIKGVIHYSMDEPEEGDVAIKAASRTTGTVVGGLIGSVAGPAGAVAGGVIGGTLTDSLTTAVDSAVHDEFRPSGVLKQAAILANDEAVSTPGTAFDLVATIAFDGLAGISAAHNFGTVDAPGVISKPPSSVEEPTKHEQLKALVYRRKVTFTGATTESSDEFEKTASARFIQDEAAGKYIREAVREAIEKTFARDVAKARKHLDAVKQKNAEGDELTSAQNALDALLNHSRYEIRLVSNNRGMDLCVPFKHLGWEAAESSAYAKFHAVSVVVDILRVPGGDDKGDMFTIKAINAYPVDAYNKYVAWKSLQEDYKNTSSGNITLYNIDSATTVEIPASSAR